MNPKVSLAVFPLIVLMVSGCTNVHQQRLDAFTSETENCNASYGFTKDSWKGWGEREIPQGWEGWVNCHQEAELKLAAGTDDYPFVLERIARIREVMEKFKTGEINRPQMNIESSKIQAEIAQRAQQLKLQTLAAQAPYVQAQQANSKAMMEMGIKMMQGPTQPQPVTTNCMNTLLGWQCQTQ